MLKKVIAIAVVALFALNLMAQESKSVQDSSNSLLQIDIRPALGEKNMGNADRIIRLGIGAALVGAGTFIVVSRDNKSGYIPIAISVVPFLTAALSRCPLYYPFGISTRKKSPSKQDISLLVGQKIGVRYAKSF